MITRIVRAIALSAFVCFGVFAQVVQVQGTLSDAFGAPITGAVTFSWPSFQTSTGQAVVAGTRTISVVNGQINVYLFPTALATPAVNYTVTIHNGISGATSTETWGIPASGPASLAQVRNLSYAGGAGLAPYALQIGNVTTLSPGSPASADIRGDSPVQTLDLNLPGGTAGAAGAPGLTLNNFTVTRTSSTVLNLANVGNVTATGSGTGEVMIFYEYGGPITVGLPSGVTATCDSGCQVAPGVTSTPTGAILLYQWSMTFGAWDLNGGIDEHAFFQFAQIIPGDGILTSQVQNQITVQVDPTYVQLPGSTPGGVGSSCTAGQYFFDSTYRWDCVAGGWKRISWGAGTGAGPYPRQEQIPFCQVIGALNMPGPFTVAFGGINVYQGGDGCFTELTQSGSGGYIVIGYLLPQSWDAGTITLTLHWGNKEGGSGNLQWNIATLCNSAPWASSPTYGTPVQVTTAAPAFNSDTTTNFTLSTTGCSPGSYMRAKIYNTPYNSGGPSTWNSPPDLIDALLNLNH